MWFVYLLENLVNGKLYVGKTNNTKRRWKEHRKIAKGGPKVYGVKHFYLHSALSKYGFDNFQFSILESCQTESQALNNEVAHISQLKAEGYMLYNLTDGGGGATGYRPSEETKQKLSIINRGRKASEETKRKMSLARRGYTQSDATKLKISIANSGKLHSEETKKEMSISRRGRKHSAESKRKISLAGKNRIVSSETKLKHSGENNPSAKLSWADVIHIRQLYSDGVSIIKISHRFNVHRKTISRICRNKSWVTAPLPF